MNSEEDEFRRIEAEALRRAAFQRKVDNVMRTAFEAAWDDDDTQSYTSEMLRLHELTQRPWVGLTPEEILDLFDLNNVYGSKWIEFARTVEAALRSKNT